MASGSAKRNVFATRTTTWPTSKRSCSEASGARVRLIATDGCFLDGRDDREPRRICDLAEKYEALMMIDDAHASGFWARPGAARTNIAA